MRYFIAVFFLILGYFLLAVEDFQPVKNIYTQKGTNDIQILVAKNDSVIIKSKPVVDLEKKWVDSVYQSLSLDEKIGQLFMVAAYSNKDSNHVYSIDKLITDYKIGGLIFFQGGPVRQAKLTNRFQSKSNVPLLIGIDAEWGLSMRLDSTYRYPWNMTLGAIKNKKLLQELGYQMALQSKRLGVHFNFAPVVDINTNPKNPIIGNRSFGEDKVNVTESAIALMRGLQSGGVFATAKHFPGHGDTDKDSHHTLPSVLHDKSRLYDIELYPYKRLIQEGLSSIMVAHLNVPSFEKRNNYPSSISYSIVTDLLKEELKFKGLIFTDALNMKGASNFKSAGDIDLEAFLAGNDVLLFPENVPLAIEKIKSAFESGKIIEKRLSHSVKKILSFKYKAGLHMFEPIQTSTLYEELNASAFDALQYRLYENAITVIKNKEDILPIANLQSQKIAYVKLGDDTHDHFVAHLNRYADVTEVSAENLTDLVASLKEYSKVIVGYHKEDGAWKNHNFKNNELVWLYEIARTNQVIFVSFAKPYALLPINTYENFESVIISYQNNVIASDVTSQIIFGALDAKGELPVSLNEDFAVLHGVHTKTSRRLGFSMPQNVGLNPAILSKIDSLANDAVHKKITPGLQVLVARRGKVVYQKSFGHHSFSEHIPVKNTDIYDVASLTKILATLPNVMQAFESGAFNLETTVGELVPFFKGTDKQNISFKDLLSHYARLQAFIPFYIKTLDPVTKKPNPKYYRMAQMPGFTKQVAENLYIRDDYHDTVMKTIAQSKLLSKKEYKYSDLTFYILQTYLEQSTGVGLDQMSEQHFFKPIGATSMGYNPLRRFDASQITPTEEDDYFRHQKIHGYVHDMGAAMQGGVGGHAGVFSNALDVAKIMQMYLQKGTYGGQRFFSEKTFDTFNTCYYCPKGVRRGMGFDKPQLGTSGPTCGCASMTSFGHTGFTGTMAWADPEQELVYVFLSNRTYPKSGDNQLSKKNIRENIQQFIYDAIID